MGPEALVLGALVVGGCLWAWLLRRRRVTQGGSLEAMGGPRLSALRPVDDELLSLALRYRVPLDVDVRAARGALRSLEDVVPVQRGGGVVRFVELGKGAAIDVEEARILTVFLGPPLPAERLPDMAPVFREMAASSYVSLRETAVRTVTGYLGVEGRGIIFGRLEDPSPQVRKLIPKALQDQHPKTKRQAQKMPFSFFEPDLDDDVRAALTRLVGDKDAGVRLAAEAMLELVRDSDQSRAAYREAKGL